MKRFFVFTLTFIFFQHLSAQEFNPRTISYKTVDSLILSLKPDKFSNPAQLADFINKSFTKEHEKLRAVFKWVTNNISYNYNSDVNAEEVFKTKKAICQGYSELMKYLCDLTDIKCEIVDGIAKNEIEYLNNPIDTTNHAWNIVTLYNRKYLLDATWAAGAVNAKNEFTKEYKNEYYLTIPETYILDHFPSNPDNQFITKKMSITEFCKAPVFDNGAIKSELTSFNPLTGKISAIKMIPINFSFEINRRIKHLDIKILKNIKQDDEEIIPISFAQTGKKTTFYWEFEKAGLFYLIIYLDNEEAMYYKVSVK